MTTRIRRVHLFDFSDQPWFSATASGCGDGVSGSGLPLPPAVAALGGENLYRSPSRQAGRDPRPVPGF